MSILGILSLIQGIGSLIVSFIPCFGWLGIGGGVIGLVLGVIGIVVANNSGRQGKGLPISGTVVSSLAILIGTAWLLVVAAFFRMADKAVEEIQEHQAKQTQEIQTGQVIVITATALCKDYNDDLVSADRKYRGKVLEVTGKIVQRVGQLTVELDTPDSSVVCDFMESSSDQLGGLVSGQTVTLRGVCQGRIGIILPGRQVKLEQCRVVKESSVVAVSVDDLNKEYSKDPVSADTKYKGKVIEVIGKVVRVNELLVILDGVTVELEGTDGIASADCTFRLPASGQAGKLAVGKKVTIRGTCTGKIGTITLEECALVR